MTDLTGLWSGIFNYPSDLPATAFAVDMRDEGGALSGEIDEPNVLDADGSILLAQIDGRRDGASVRFVKYYAAPTRAFDTVYYDGMVDEEGTEITGRWDIPGEWSGTFIMTREAPAGVAIEAETAAVRD